jgi:3-oxoacyl-[acyl-carrier-protein] synthase III
MRLDDIYIDSLGVRLGRPHDLADAVASGRYDEDEYIANAMTSVVVADEFPPDLGIAAVRQAFDRATVAPEAVRLMLHASLYFQGQDMWTPATYIQQHTIGGTAPSVHLHQMSNGGMAALGLGTAYLSASDEDAAVLLVTSDRFCDPGYDRYRTEASTVMGDGATATVLARRPGFARVLSVVLTADPSLEALNRGDGLRDHPGPGDRPLDLRARRTKYMRGRVKELEELSAKASGGITDTILQALDEAKTELADVRRVVLPNVGRTARWWSMLQEMGIPLERTSWEWGRTIGHLGCGDEASGLHHLLETHEVGPGDRVVIAGAGHGFYWGAGVVEILETPRWATL